MRKRELETIEIQPISIKKNSDAAFIVEAYVRDTKSDNVLVLDIYENDSNNTMMARHFIDKKKEKYLTLFMSTQKFINRTYNAGEWSQMSFDTILKRGNFYYGYCREKDIIFSESSGIYVKSYFPTYQGGSVSNLISMQETQMSWNNQEKSFERKRERIENLMRKVRPITKTEEFQRWIRETVFSEKYIFAETMKYKRGYRTHCSECGATYFLKEKPKHNTKSICKKCGQECITKTRVRELYENKKVLVIQQVGESWVLRHFRFTRYSGTSKLGTKTGVYHAERIRIFNDKKTRKIYYGESHSNCESEDTQTWWTKKNGMVFDHDFYLYPDSLKDLSIEQGLKGVLIQCADKGKHMDYNNLIRGWSSHPYLEYIIKSGLYKLADEIATTYVGWGHPVDTLELLGKSPSRLLKIAPQRIHRLKDMDGGLRALRYLQEEERSGKKISQENLLFAEKNNIDFSELQIKRTQLSINKALGYIRRQVQKNNLKTKQILQYYKDYLDMAEDRGMDLTDDIVRLQSRMIEFHDRYLEEKNRAANKKEYARVNRKFKKIHADYEKNTQLFGYKDGDLIMLLPQKASDIKKEGQLQHHCVGASDNYMEKMNKRTSFILFLRRKDNPDIPYYTIEAESNGTIKQFYAAYNRQPDRAKISSWLKKWTREVKKRNQKLEKETKKDTCLQAAV